MKETYRSTICNWPINDRPRERLAKYGEHNLSNTELLAILLRTGVKGETAIDLARKILNKFKTFRNMSHTDSRFTTPIIREIFQKALQNFATSIICVHNHPSGIAAPSHEDREFTRKLKQVGEAMQISVLDHIIIGNNAHYSFTESV
ncbi:MAG TPA: JAB domain-containing protein [Candidatus Omnitrophota bacterium]|nr:JAB domain-containing protein [Candidatus Omnitrophota bacterium]